MTFLASACHSGVPLVATKSAIAQKNSVVILIIVIYLIDFLAVVLSGGLVQLLGAGVPSR
jgi:hypothetical protein